MEQKTYLIQNLDCANCAAKIEDKINRLQADAKIRSVLLKLEVTEANVREGKRQFVFNSFRT